MANTAQLIQAIREAPSAITAGEIATKLHLKVASFSTQLGRLVEEKKLVIKNDDGSYELSDAGKAWKEELNMETAGLTPSQQFKKLGQLVGLKEEMVDLIAGYVFDVVNDYTNLEKVWEALNRMRGGMRVDQINNWFHAWAAKCNVQVPLELEAKLKGGGMESGEKKAEEKKADAAKEEKNNLVFSESKPENDFVEWPIL